MKLLRRIGFLLTLVGLVLYSPPVSKVLIAAWGKIGEIQGVIIFAIGWALLLADLVFHLGKQSQSDPEQIK
ncbi:MAG: hypothetical protein WCA08_13925 [Desulfoferrobacter sp.]